MNDTDLQELLDKVVAGRLSPDEERRWNALLASRPELEEEVALAEAMRALPAPPLVSSNFTSLVMQEIRRTKREPTRPARLGWLRLPLLLRFGATAAVMALLFFGAAQRREGKQAREAAETIAASVDVVDDENVLAVFRDFEAIRQLPLNTPGLDDKFLSALAK